MIAFIGDAPLVAHNASFDLSFLNAELERCGKMLLARERLVDTLLLARRRHPAGPNGLDHLCARYGIDNSRRTKHGALLDAELLAEVYVELIGGRQASLILVETGRAAAVASGNGADRRAAAADRPAAAAVGRRAGSARGLHRDAGREGDLERIPGGLNHNSPEHRGSMGSGKNVAGKIDVIEVIFVDLSCVWQPAVN